MLAISTVVLQFCILLIAVGALERVSEGDKAYLTEVCGMKLADKLLEYSKFQADVLSQKEPQRYIVSVPVEAGLADRLTGIISQFWLAFFSRRAFQIAAYDRLPQFEYAYDYRFINWTRPPDPPEYTANLLYTFRGIRGYDGDRSYDRSKVNVEENFADYIINKGNRAEDIFRKMNLAHYPDKSKAYPAKHSVFTSSNRGGLHYLFDNAEMKKVLKEIGMEKHSAFRCAYAFLFKENAETNRISEPYLAAMKSHRDKNSSLIIGIGIRAGDNSFDPHLDAKLTSSVYTALTGCAEKVEQTYFEQHPEAKTDGETLPWFVMAESLHTRRMIADKYKQKVVTDVDNTYFHGDCAHKTHGGCDEGNLRAAITHAASQLQLFMKCNLHITSDSGFPRVGAFLSKPPYHIYNTFTDCTYGKFQNPDVIMSMGAGLRI